MQAKAILASCNAVVQKCSTLYHQRVRSAIMIVAIWVLFGGLPPSTVQAQGPIPEVLLEFDFAAGQISYPSNNPQTLIKAVERIWPEERVESSSLYVKTNVPEDDFVDNWLTLMQTSADNNPFPPVGCNLFDNQSDGKQYLWGKDSYRSLSPPSALWPVKGGNDGLIPALEFYPSNSSSWLDCGPYDFQEGQKLFTRFGLWLDIADNDDRFGLLVSTDGMVYRGIEWTGVQDWTRQNILFRNLQADQVYIAWTFESDSDQDTSEGAWIDDLEISRYDTPSSQCGGLDTGVKGIHIPAFDPTAMPLAPIFREGDTSALSSIIATQTDWIRLGFFHRDGLVRIREFDRIIDSLCAQDIATLGLLNHQSLTRSDFNQDIDGSYREEFADLSAFLVRHYQGRVSHWEIWNEPNLNEGNPAPRLEPDAYAELLKLTYDRIKQIDSSMLVLFGGLASAWEDSFLYFDAVYDYWDSELDLNDAIPFDILAIHPYPNVRYGPNPSAYLIVEQPTILAKFSAEIQLRGDGDKPIWVTEVGWNSSKESPSRPTCLDAVLVTESEQAMFLKPAFDTLISDGNVKKVFWYQLLNTGIETPCNDLVSQSVSDLAHSALSSEPVNLAGVDWWYGLFEGDKVQRKQVFDHFRAYPQGIVQYDQNVYLPMIIK